MTAAGKCRHRSTHHRRWTGSEWRLDATIRGVNCFPDWVSPTDSAVVCQDCGEWLPLSPSNDSDPRVQVEIRAAEAWRDDVCGPKAAMLLDAVDLFRGRGKQ